MAKKLLLNFFIMYVFQLIAEIVKKITNHTDTPLSFIIVWSLIVTLIFLNLSVYFVRHLKANPDQLAYINSLKYVEYVAGGVIILAIIFGRYDLLIGAIGNTIAVLRITKDFNL